MFFSATGVFSGYSSAAAASLDIIQLLKISPQDQRAIIKTADGQMQIIKVGDSLGEDGKVVEIVQGRVVIEEQTEQGVETVIIRLEGGKQKIERVRKAPEKQQALHAPTIKKSKE
ncbi:MAG: hypothetical protein AB1805_01330 [Nitrospirota bacterium]